MSSDGSGQRFTTRVADIEGTWPDPPAWWSFSSLSEVEACPRRWSLSHANYPEVWDRPGYPEYTYVGTVVGHVIHGSLEIIIGELVRAGCTTVEDASAVNVLRLVGGYTQLLRDQIEAQLSRLADNPRCAARLDQLRRDLLTRLPEMRQSVQALVARSEFKASGSGGAVAKAGSTADGPRADGTYTEVEVRSNDLSFSGRIDLLTVSGQDVHIQDYKSGEPSTEHEEQLRTYATLWARRSDPGLGGPLATRLTLSYVAHDVEVETPKPDDIDRLARELRARVKDAAAQLTATEPDARPTADTCKFCSVRHLCEDYWRTTDRPLTAGVADLEIEVITRNGPRSWFVRTGAATEGILRTSEGEELTEGQKRRLLGAFVSPAEEDEPLTISLSAKSEAYLLRADN